MTPCSAALRVVPGVRPTIAVADSADGDERCLVTTDAVIVLERIGLETRVSRVQDCERVEVSDGYPVCCLSISAGTQYAFLRLPRRNAVDPALRGLLANADGRMRDHGTPRTWSWTAPGYPCADEERVSRGLPLMIRSIPFRDDMRSQVLCRTVAGESPPRDPIRSAA